MLSDISPIKVYKILVAGIIGLYGIKLILGRFLIFYTVYIDLSQEKKFYEDRYRHCLDDHKTYHSFTNECEFAQKKIDHWVFFSALEEVIVKRTYSCVEYPCTDVIKSIMESWISVIFVCIFLLITFFYLFPYIIFWNQNAYIEYYKKGKEKKEKEKKEKEKKKHIDYFLKKDINGLNQDQDEDEDQIVYTTIECSQKNFNTARSPQITYRTSNNYDYDHNYNDF